MSNYRNAYGAGAAPHHRPPLGQESHVEANPRHYGHFPEFDHDDLYDEDLAVALLDNYDQVAGHQPYALAPAGHAWLPDHDHGAAVESGSDGDREDSELGDDDDRVHHQPIWASDSEEDGAVSDSEDNDDRTPSPSLSLHHDSDPLGALAISDAGAESEGSIVSASARRSSAAGAGSSASASLSPRRRPSLTPVYHPNRRLPRQSPAQASGRRHSSPHSIASDFDTSDDEPVLQQRPLRRLGIERTRRPRNINQARVLIDFSDGELEEQLLASLPRPRQQVEIPDSPIYDSGDTFSDPDSIYGDHVVHHPGHEEEEPYSDPEEDYGDHIIHRSVQQNRVPEDHSDRDSDYSDHIVHHPVYQVQEQEEEEPSDDHTEEDLSTDEDFGQEQEQTDNEEEGLSDSEQSHSEGSHSGEEQELAQELIHIESDDEDELEAAVLRTARQQQAERRNAFFRQAAVVNLPTQARGVWAARNPGHIVVDEVDSGEENMDVDDELVEVVLHNYNERHQQRHNNRRQNSQNSQARNNNQGRAIDVIDLTEEPDSPVIHQHGLHHQGNARQDNLYSMFPRPLRHPRRMAQNGRPPSLARSDGSILGNPRPGHATFIDLTNDDEPDAAAPDDDDDDGLFVPQNNDHIPANRRLPQPIPAPQRRNNRPSLERFDIVRDLGPALGFPLNYLRGHLANVGHRLFHDNIRNPHYDAAGMDANVNPNPLADNPPNFNYQANGWAVQGERAKPQFEGPPSTRDGFTRNTGPDPETGEEQTFICASCDDELKYYDDEVGEPPAKRAKKGKKAREEHHFWAVKACGHVYCKNCYENRRKIVSLGDEYHKMGFRVQQRENVKAKDIFCAVDDCESEVSAPSAWVGIFM